MTTIVCRSPFLARELATLVGADSVSVYPAEPGAPEVFRPEWLMRCLAENPVALVLYEPRYFVDPAPFRAASPETHFVIISGPGDERNALMALANGASAVIEKPCVARDVCGVLSLVSL